MFLRALKPSAPSSPGRAATPLTLPTNQRNQRVATLLKAVTEARWNPFATFLTAGQIWWELVRAADAGRYSPLSNSTAVLSHPGQDALFMCHSQRRLVTSTLGSVS